MKGLEQLTLGQVLEKSAAASPDKVAVIDADARITYSQLNASAEALAAGLSEMGFQKGDRIAFLRRGDEVVLQPLTDTLLDLRGSVPVEESQDFAAIRDQVIQDHAGKVAQSET